MNKGEFAKRLLIELQTPRADWIPVGEIASVNDRNTFRSLAEYWENPDRVLLGRIFEEQDTSWSPSVQTSLPRWFSHLLPQGLLRREVSMHADIKEVREFPLLSALGASDLPGAVRATPLATGRSGTEIEHYEFDESDASERALKFSLAGLQLKFSLRSTDRGPTVPVSGEAGDSILKLPDGRPEFDSVPDAEFGAMSLARAVGLNIAGVQLMDARSIEGLEKWAAARSGQSLLVDRFDRRSDTGHRVHTEELAQVLNIASNQYSHKYTKANFESIVSLIMGLSVQADAIEAIRRIHFNIIIGNGDAHLKNWGLIYEDGINARLSPGYDILPTVLYMPNDDLGLNIGGTKSFNDIRYKHFSQLAAIADVDSGDLMSLLHEDLDKVKDNWSIMVDNLPANLGKKLSQRLIDLPLVADR